MTGPRVRWVYESEAGVLFERLSSNDSAKDVRERALAERATGGRIIRFVEDGSQPLVLSNDAAPEAPSIETAKGTPHWPAIVWALGRLPFCSLELFPDLPAAVAFFNRPDVRMVKLAHHLPPAMLLPVKAGDRP